MRITLLTHMPSLSLCDASALASAYSDDFDRRPFKNGRESDHILGGNRLERDGHSEPAASRM